MNGLFILLKNYGLSFLMIFKDKLLKDRFNIGQCNISGNIVFFESGNIGTYGSHMFNPYLWVKQNSISLCLKSGFFQEENS